MKVSQLIEQLKQFQQENGDLDIVIRDYDLLLWQDGDFGSILLEPSKPMLFKSDHETDYCVIDMGYMEFQELDIASSRENLESIKETLYNNDVKLTSQQIGDITFKELADDMGWFESLDKGK